MSVQSDEPKQEAPAPLRMPRKSLVPSEKRTLPAVLSVNDGEDAAKGSDQRAPWHEGGDCGGGDGGGGVSGGGGGGGEGGGGEGGNDGGLQTTYWFLQ